MNIGEKLKEFLPKDIKGGATKLGRAMLLNELKKGLLPYLAAYLEGLGEQKLRFLLKENISLWRVVPDKPQVVKAIRDHAPGVLKGLPLARLLTLVDVGAMATVIQEIIKEKCPRYDFITREWIIMSLAELRKAIQ